MKKISVAVDFSDVMPYVLEQAVKVAHPSHGTIYLVHVIETSPAYGMYGFSPEEIPMVGPSAAELRDAVQTKLKATADELRAQGVTVHEVILDGSPLDELMHYVEENGIDLLVVGSHGHGLLASMLLGSVADGAVRRAKIPVLVVPYMKKTRQ